MEYTDKAPLEYAEFLLCREMKWTFAELEEQPAERIQQAFAFLDLEGKIGKLKRGSGGAGD